MATQSNIQVVSQDIFYPAYRLETEDSFPTCTVASLLESLSHTYVDMHESTFNFNEDQPCIPNNTS